MFYGIETRDKMKGEDLQEGCVKVLKKITNPTIANTEKAIQLAIDIIEGITNRLKGRKKL